MTALQQRFLERIDSLGAGERAALRRDAGIPMRQADGKAIAAFYKCLPSGVNSWQEERWFAVACIHCLWSTDISEEETLEKLLSKLIRTEELSDSIRHRVESLLDTKWDSDGYLLIKLSRLIKLVRQKSDRKKINSAQLLKDLIDWNEASQYVQRKWAKIIFSNNNDSEEEER